MSDKAFVAEGAERAIEGAITFKTIRVGQRRVGVLDWGVVDPSCQGQGIGKALLGHTLRHFRRQNCDEVLTTDVDGYDSGSWNACYAHGFRYWPISQQIRKFGRHWPCLLLKIPHIGVGSFILHSRKDQHPTKPSATSGLCANIGVTLLTGFFLLPLSRSREVLWESTNVSELIAPFRPSMVIAGLGVVAAYVGARMAAHWLASRAAGLSITFRPWDSGLLMAAVLAAAFSAFVPAFGGNVYARQTSFRYDRARPVLGKIILAGVGASIVLFTFFTMCAETNTLISRNLAELGRYAGLAFGLTDTVFFFPPFQAVAAGHLWLWHRGVWFATLAAFLFVWLVLPRLL